MSYCKEALRQTQESFWLTSGSLGDLLNELEEVARVRDVWTFLLSPRPESAAVEDG